MRHAIPNLDAELSQNDVHQALTPLRVALAP